jgi:hypothetical protein
MASSLKNIFSQTKSMDNLGRGPGLEVFENGRPRIFNTVPFVNYMVFNNTPYWQRLMGMQSLFDWYHLNPVLFSTIMIKAREGSNQRFQMVNRDTGKVEPEGTRKDIPKRVYAKMRKPNVLQSRWEFLKQRKIFEQVAGNSFTYGNFAMMKPSPQSITALWNVWPAHMQFKLAGKYFEATEITDVIKEWKFEAGNYKKIWEPHEIMHRNEPNTNVNDGLIFGRSNILSLVKPLTNIDMAYESRNVMMRNRGMRMMITSDKGDASGRIPLMNDEKTTWQEESKNYGMLEGQSQFFFSSLPLRAVPIDQDVMKLGLFEEIATDAMVVCNAFGVPEILLKLYIKGATFENQEASVRRLYQGTLIPEADDDVIALNSFLGLDDTEWMLLGSFDHVPVLQESEVQRESVKKSKSERLLKELAQGIITIEEYRAEMYPHLIAA